MQKGPSTQQHVETIIHHLYMIIKETDNEQALKKLETCISCIKSLHHIVTQSKQITDKKKDKELKV